MNKAIFLLIFILTFVSGSLFSQVNVAPVESWIEVSLSNCSWIQITNNVDNNGEVHTFYDFTNAPDASVMIYEDASQTHLLMKGELISGKQEGEWEIYENDLLLEKITYLNNIRTGLYEKYYDTGELMMRCFYQNNKISGLYYYFNKDGSILTEIDFGQNANQ
jgi:antitoxin component YwqK of YwqJK toxin-antitoxin module